MKVAVSADHAGFRLKECIKQFLEGKSISYCDLGADSLDESDYPDYAQAVALAVARGEVDRGIIVCGTGIGSCIAANKIPGIRAALCHEALTAVASRAHNDANVLCLGERVLGERLACHIVEAWLNAEFSGEERHRRRLAKITQLEQTEKL